MTANAILTCISVVGTLYALAFIANGGSACPSRLYMGNAMKKLALVAVASAALATPALASDHINVNVVLKNTSLVSQGGRNGSADVALVAQGALATVQAPTSSPTVVINTGFAGAPIGSSFSWTETTPP